MKINNINEIYKNNMIQKGSVNKKEDRNAAQKDTVQISEMAKKIHDISNENDPVQNKKIEELKNSINNNTYKVDTNKLAEKIYKALQEGKHE